MAETITLTYSAGSLSKSRSLPDGSGARIVAAAKTRLNMPGATNAQVFAAIADEFFQNLKQQTLNTEREQARLTADAGVSDIPLT
jgi:hypothetical protein